MKTEHQVLVGFCLAMTVMLVVLSVSLPSSPHMMEVEEAIRSRPPFVMKNFTLTIKEPTVNPVVGQINWLEDLSWKDPPVCNGSDPFILAMVITAVDHFPQRERVRNTWAKPDFFQYTGIKAVFVVGSTNNTALQESLDEEIDTYEDIIQNDFVDTYRNLTFKTIAWLSWASRNCPGTPFIAKIDDDVVVNPFNLRMYLHNHLLKDKSPKNIHGRARFRAKPMRNSKWSVTQEEYPDDKYPPIILGSAYVVDRNAVDILLAYVPYVPMLWLEDVYLTGLVARKAGITLKQAERALYTRRLTRKLYYGSVAFLIDPKEKDYAQAWQGIMKYSQKVITKLKKK